MSELAWVVAEVRELRLRLEKVEEAAKLMAEKSHFLGDHADRQRLHELGFSPAPMERTDGG